MLNYDFQRLLTAQLRRCLKTLSHKAGEYATNTDRLHNFKRAACMLICSSERALVGMWTKHLVSVFDIVDKIDNGVLPSKELLDEKITDIINYAILLRASIEERIENIPKTEEKRE